MGWEGLGMSWIAVDVVVMALYCTIVYDIDLGKSVLTDRITLAMRRHGT